MLPFCNVDINGVNPKYGQRQARDMLIRQGEYEHDVAQVTIHYDTSTLPQYTAGNALTLQWGWEGGITNTFVGYVHHATPKARSDHPPAMVLNCVSASNTMSATSERVFTNAFVPDVVGAIASVHGFASVVSPEVQRIFAMLPQLSRSNWDFLVWVAQQCGFSLTCDKTTLYIQPRRIDTSDNVPTFTLIRGTAVQQNAIYNFTQRDGVSPFNSHDILAAVGITDDGSIINLIEHGDPADIVPRVIKQNVERVVTDLVHGYEQLSGQLGLDTFHVDGNATVSGNASVRPAGTVRMSQVDPASDGFWWVNSVDHHVTPLDYRMDLCIARDSVPQALSSPVVRSWAGKPEIASVPGVTGSMATVPDTTYAASDPAQAVEPLGNDPFTGLVSATPVDRSPARAIARRQRPVPSRVRSGSPQAGCCTPDLTPRYNAWRSTSSAQLRRRA